MDLVNMNTAYMDEFLWDPADPLKEKPAVRTMDRFFGIKIDK